MATEWIYLKGKVKWPRLVKPDEKYERWSLNLYLDKASKKVFDKSGLQLSFKSDDDGEFITLARPKQKKIGSDLVDFQAPEVIGPTGEPLDGGKIGNGSSITAKVAVFDTKKGKGHRLEAVRVDELQEYVREGEYF